MYHRLSGKLLRVVLPFILAVLGLALLLGLFAGPRNVVHALSRRERPQVDEPLASVEFAPPSRVTLASPRPPQSPLQEVTQAPVVWTVCPLAAGSCDFTAVQAAVNSATAGDTIKVAQGTYTDDDLDGIVVEITKTLTLRGGYTTTNWSESYPDLYPTVLDGVTLHRVIHVADSASPEIEGFHIRNGSASDGAGVYVASGSPALRRNRIFGNTASSYGGGLYLANGTATIENCMVYDNEAVQKRGGGIYVAQGSPTVRYSVFYGNESQEQGGGIYIAGGSFTMYGTILAGNSASDGGGIYATGSHQIDYNDYDGNAPNNWNAGFTAGPNDSTDPPQFVNAGAGDFHLQPGSPCIDSGDISRYPAVDYAGLGRYFGSKPDMGAYESYLGTCFARISTGRVHTNVQDAVDDPDGDGVIQVAGLCTGTGTSPVVYINKDLTLRGGYTLTNWTDADPDLLVTVLYGEYTRRVIDVANFRDVTIEGFHIRGGYPGSGGDGGGIRLGNGDYVIRQCRIYLNESDGRGGGIYVGSGTIRIEHNQIYSNTSGAIGGGGIALWDASSGLVRDNDIFANDASSGRGAGLYIGNAIVRVENNRIYLNLLSGYGGGGIYVSAGNSTIVGNEVYSNWQFGAGSNGGGGIYIYGGSSTVERNAVYGNSADAGINPGGGGGIYVETGNSVIRNNLVYSNTVDSDNEGGGIFRWGGYSVIENNTCYGNQAGNSGWGGGGIYDHNDQSSVNTIRNNIVANNINGEGVNGRITTDVCVFCDVWGNTLNNISGTGSVSADPLFVQPGVDFHLLPGSRCRDSSGTPYPEYDYDGYARPFGATADIGAHEYYEGNCFARLGIGSVYTTVQEAVDAAITIGPVYVAGVCTATVAPVATIDEQLTLRGGYTLTNWLTPSTGTILDGGGSQRVVEISGTDPVTVDGFIIRNGNATDGAGLYIASAVDAWVQNVIFYDNVASGNGILASVGGNSQLYNNTFVDNSVGAGGIVHISAGSPVVSNTIIVSNTGNAIAGATCYYCDILYNDDDNGGDANSIDLDPRFVDYAGDDFHLRSDSPCVYAGDSNTNLDHDFEGHPRKLGNGYDIGADECASYPGLEFEPKSRENRRGAPGASILYTYTLTNTGGAADTFVLTYSLDVSGTTVWDVDYESPIDLDGGASTVVDVNVLIPTDEISGSVGAMVLTATSQLNPALYEVVTNVTYISWNPGVTITPVFSDFLNPGDTYTQANTIYQHTLLNTGNAPDSFTLTFSSLRGWSGITPTTVSDLDPGASTTIWFVIAVSDTMPGGVTETVVITAFSSRPSVSATITNTFEVNQVPGDRYVWAKATDPEEENNCLVHSKPCRTIGHALGQAVNGDTIKVATGVYAEHDLSLRMAITIAGGYTRETTLPSYWDPGNLDQVPDPVLNRVIVDAQGLGRVIEIWDDAKVEGLTLRGGSVSGSGGGVYIGDRSPILRNNLIVSNTAGARGGGVYNDMGTPTIEQNEIAHNTAYHGGGFATGSATPGFWNNLVYANTALADGGGVYVVDGAPLIWHDTIYDNDAERGGGVYVAGGSPVVSNTIIATNTGEAIVGATCHYCDLYGNDDNAGGDAYSRYQDPLFVDRDAYNLHLGPGSPCTNTADVSPLIFDLDGDPRVVGPGPDIGADEFVWGTIEFTPDYTGLISHCLSISYPHLVTHTGRYTDTFSFVPQSTQDVTVTIVPSVTLGHDMTTTVDVTITVPCTPTDPVMDTTVIAVRSKSYAFIENAVTETTFINVVPYLELEPDREGYSPPGSIFYTHTLTNGGNYTDTITFDYYSPHGWGVNVIDSVTLGPDASTVITVEIVISGNPVSGTVEATVITATTMFSDMVNGIPISATVVDTTTVGPRPAVDVRRTLAPEFDGICAYPPPITAWLSADVYNMGNLTDTFELDALLEVYPWYTTIVTMGGWLTETPPISITLPPVPNPAFSDLVWVVVRVPTGTTNAVDTVWLTATSQADNTVWDAVSWTIDVADADVDMSPPVTHSIVMTEPSVSYQRTLTNTGTFENDILVSYCEGFPHPPGWDVQFPPTLVDVPVDGVRTYAITVIVPMNVSTATEQLCFTARTRERCIDIDNEVEDTIIVRRPGVTIEPNRNPQNDPEATVIPGTVVTYTYVLSNSGAYSDTYTLTWTPNPSPAWPTWTVTLSPTTSPVMTPGDQITVVAVMTVPAGMPADETGRLVVTATSSYADEIYDTAIADMIVPPSPMARITPNHHGQARPGEWITYTHILTNVGNVADLFEITTRPGDYATAEVLTPTSVWLAPSQVYTGIVVRVSILPHAQIGEVDETRVIVSFGEEVPGEGRPQAVAIDSTTITPFTGTRYVAIGGTDEDNNCTDPQGFGPCATIQHAVDQASPGDEIRVATGIYADVHSTNDVTQVVYLDKSVILRGGYVHPEWQTYDPFGNPTTIDALGQGRAIYVDAGITPTIAGFHLTGGYLDQVGEHGAGLYIAAGAVPTVEMNVIYGNAAQGIAATGGGVYYGGPGGLVFQQNTLYDNEAEDGSGAYIVGDAKVWNNVFHSNVASSLGGGLYLDGGSATVWNNTFFENAADRGGGVYYSGSGTAVVSNTIFAGNTCAETNGGAAVFQASGTVNLAYIIYNANADSDAMTSGGVPIPTQWFTTTADPLFVDPAAHDLHLKPNSPCKNAGDPNTVVDEDRDGKARPLLGGYDVGAYEYGLEFAKVGRAIIAPGEPYTYTIIITNTGNLDRQNVPVTDTLSPYLEFVSSPMGQYIPATRTITWTVSISRNSTVQLDFTAQVTSNLSVGDVITNVAWVDLLQTNVVTSVYRTCWVRLNDDPTDYTTVQAAVDASQDGNDVVKVAGTCSGVEARAGISQVVYLSKTLTVQGGWNALFGVRDVGLYTSTLDALGQGRVIYVSGDVSPTIEGLHITGGDATGVGGAGGGVYVGTATATLEGNVILSNTADVGGGVCLVDSESRLVNNAIVDNQAATAGSGLYVDGNNVTMLHNTLARNGGTGSHGIYVTGLGTVVLTNTIVATHAVGVQADVGSTAVVSSVLWYDNTTDDVGTVLISDPHFGDPAFDTDGYHLTIRSEARDRGIDAGIVVDIDGHSRLAAGVPDLGADEVLASLQVTKVADPDPVHTGEQITYTIRVTNTGEVALDVIVTDTRSSEVTPTGVITWDLGTLVPGQSAVRTFAVTVTAGYSGPLVNRVDAASIYGVTATHTITSDADGTAAITVTKDVEPFSAQAGEQITYTIYVTNTGDVILHPTVIDTPPLDVTPSGPQVYLLAPLDPDETVSWTLVVTPDLGYSGLLTNVVRATSPEGATAAYTLTSQVDVSPQVTVTKVASDDPVQAGDWLTYTVYVTNTGNITLNLTITDYRPLNASPGGAIAWAEQLSVPSGAVSRTVSVLVDWGYSGTLTNVVVVADSDLGVSETFTLCTQVEVTPQVTVTKVASDDPVQAGAPLTYTIYVTNTGNITLTTTITDYRPLNASPGGVISWTNKTLPVPNGTWSTTVHVTPDLGYAGWLTNVVVVADSDLDVSETFTLYTRVEVTPQVTVTKVASDDPVQAGTPLTYTIYVTNTGNVTLTATITDYRPLNASPGGVISWTNKTLPVPNGTWSTTVHVTPDLGYEGVLTNVVVVADGDLGVSETFTLYTQVDVSPQVTVTKVASDDPVQAGHMLTYTIHVTNTGNVTLTATITEYYPGNATPVGTYVWPAQELGVPNGTWSATVYVTPDLDYAGWLTNVVVVSTTQGAGATYTETTLSLAPYVSVTKEVSDDPVQAGDPLTYTIYVTNTGTMDLHLTVTDTLPSHVTHVTATGTLTWTLAVLPRGGVWTATVPLVVHMGYSGTLTNTVEAASTEGATDTFMLLSDAWVTPRLSVTKVASDDPVDAGDTLTYTVYVTNTGNVTLTTTITDYLPAHVTHVSATNVLTWTPVLTAPDDSWSTQFTVTVEWGYSGTLTNTVDVTSKEGATGTHELLTQARVTPRMSVTKHVEPQSLYAGGQLTYTIHVTNTGNVTLTTTITDFLDPHVTHVTATNVLTWTPVLTAPGGTWSTQFTVTVDAGYPGTVTNVVEVYADEGATEVATATALSLAPAVTITKWASPPVVQAGEQLTYTIVVTNNGTLPLNDLVITDTRPLQGSPTGIITFARSTLVTGSVWTEQVVVTVEWGYSGTLVNDVLVTTTEGVSATYRETSYAEVRPAVSITKRAAAPDVLAGEPITFTIYVTNTGNVTLTATVTDYYPLYATPGGTITWTRQLTQFTGTWVVTTVITPDLGYAGWLTNVVVVSTTQGAGATYTETTLSLAPYVSVTKEVSDDPVQAGDPLTYTIYVTNTGTMDLHLTVTDTLPSHVTHVTATGTLTWTPAVLLPGGVWTATVPLVVHMGYSGTLTNTVEAASTEGATDTFVLLSDAWVTPRLSVTKEVYPAVVDPGAQLTYTIRVTNTGNVTLTATITDIFPAQVSPNTTLTWTAEIAPGEAVSYEMVVTADVAYAGALLNEVQVTTEEGAAGSDTAVSAVCVPMTDLTLVGPTLGLRGMDHAFTATIAPPTATMPLTYTWEATGYSPRVRASSVPSDVETFSWAADGTYTVTVTVDNDCVGTISRSHVITVSACPFPLTGVTVAGPGSGYVTTTYVFTSAIVPPDPTLPITYTWTPAPDGGQGTGQAQYLWTTPGTYDITLEVESCGGTVSDTHTVVVYPPCVGVSGVTIVGPRSGISNTLHTFVANVSPASASTPMTYTWSPPPASGQGTATAQYQWPADGSYTISVTVENCGGTASDDHTIIIQPVQPIYLPLVMRNYRDAPDLEVTAIQIFWGTGTNPDYVQVTIRNNGPAPVTTDFWVDLYLDPSRVPAAGDLWSDLGSQGKAWFVRNPTILPGGTIVLDTRDPDDPSNPHLRFSIWPDQLPVGAHSLYAQADSYWRPSGMVIETDETNNVLLHTYVQGMSQSVVPTPPSPPVLDTPAPISTPKPRPTPKEQPTPEP